MKPRAVACWVAVACCAGGVGVACATGGDAGGGDDDASAGSDTRMDAPGDAGPSDGAARETGPQGDAGDGGVSVETACADNATSYCTQLATCSKFLLETEYGDMATCVARLAYCTDVVTAKGSGWTAAGLETCVKARAKLSCEKFLYERPAPASCTPVGTLKTGAACLYGTQCATGYCRTTAGSSCGSCTALGDGDAACASSNDCESSLMCSSAGSCVTPSVVGAACSATAPCQLGLDCVAGLCAQPEPLGGTCSTDGGAPCDPELGVYCGGSSCAALSVVKDPGACGGTTHAACYGGGACLGGACAGPVADGKACDGGVPCLSPSTCNAGKCSTVLSASCK